MSKPKSNVSDLLAAIRRKTAAPTHEPEPTPKSPEKLSAPPLSRESGKSSRRKTIAKSKAPGMRYNVFLHEEDRKLIRELAAWLAGQGIRTSDSGVIKAALRTAAPGKELLEAYRQASLLDARVTRDSNDKVA